MRVQVSGTPERPRLAVHKSNQHIYAQVSRRAQESHSTGRMDTAGLSQSGQGGLTDAGGCAVVAGVPELQGRAYRQQSSQGRPRRQQQSQQQEQFLWAPNACGFQPVSVSNRQQACADTHAGPCLNCVHICGHPCGCGSPLSTVYSHPLLLPAWLSRKYAPPARAAMLPSTLLPGD